MGIIYSLLFINKTVDLLFPIFDEVFVIFQGVVPMITNTQMLQYVDCENDCQSHPWVFPDRDFPAYYACIYDENLKSTL